MPAKPSILVVDDEMGPRESLKMILNPYYNVHTADRGTQAVEMLKQVPVDLVTVDLKMPGFSGINVLEKVKQHDPDIEAIIITGYGSLDTAIEGLSARRFRLHFETFRCQSHTFLGSARPGATHGQGSAPTGQIGFSVQYFTRIKNPS